MRVERSRSFIRVVLLGIETLATAAFLVARPSPAATPSDPPNVVIVTIDTLRADHVGCYGYEAAQTPNIDSIAHSGIRFSRAYTPVPITLPAHASLFTGSFPMATGMHDFSGNKLPAETLTLARVLRDNGYTTAAFIGAAVLDSRFGLNQGFDTYFDYFDFSRLLETNLDQMERRGDLVMDEALSWLKRAPRRPFFLWVHLYDPHHPYTPPEPYATRFRSHPYDGEIVFDDAQLGRLVTFLKDQRIFDQTLFVIAGDHGEGLGEHGENTHGFFIYNSTLHVPLIFKIPEVSSRVVDEEVSLVDVMPTILQALRIQIPGSVQGRSLLGLALGRTASTPSTLYAETYLPLLHFRWNQLRSLQSRGIKYIDAPRPEIYDTEADPAEMNNLYGSRQALGNEMRDRLNGLIRRLTAASGGAAEKELTDPALLERLKSLGYVAVSSGTFADAAGEKLPDPKDRIETYELVSEALADSQQGRYRDSLAKLQKAEATEKNSLTINYLTALNHFRLGDFPHAIERLRATLRIDPKFALATYYLGQAQVRTNDIDGATVSFERTLELDPTNFIAAFNLGAAYLKKQRVDAALRQFKRATEINPQYARAYGALGEVYLYLKRPEDAVRALERAISLAPGASRAHYNLGLAYRSLGRTADAQREFDRAETVAGEN